MTRNVRDFIVVVTLLFVSASLASQSPHDAPNTTSNRCPASGPQSVAEAVRGSVPHVVEKRSLHLLLV